MPRLAGEMDTLRLDRFAEEYVRDFNATRAYLRTYSRDGESSWTSKEYESAAVQGSKLLKRPEVRALIQAAARRRLDRLEITSDRVLQEWARIGFFDPRDLLDAAGRPLPLDALPTHVATALSVEVGPDGCIKRLEPHDKDKALELLAKYLKLLVDAPPAPQWSLDPATLSKMSTEDLETALKHAERVQDLLAGKKPEPTP